MFLHGTNTSKVTVKLKFVQMRGEFYVRKFRVRTTRFDSSCEYEYARESPLSRAIPNSLFKYWVADRMNERAASERDAAS